MKLNLKSCLSILPVVALLGAAACGGSNNQNQQPMTPAAGANQPGMAGNDATSTTTTPGSTQAAPTDSSMSGGTSMQGGMNGSGSSMSGQSGMPSSGQSGQSGMGSSGQSGMTGSGQSGMSGNGGTAGMGGSSADQGSLNDAQIAQVLDTLNRGEEKEAQLAVGKAKDAKVKQFANMMLTGHRDANKKLMADVKKANITPAQSSTSSQLDNDAMQMTDAIRNKTGADFDKQYIDDQVKMHTQALDMIDNRLMPNAKDATLKANLQTIRASVADHLRRAQDLQSNMSGGGSSGSSGSTGTQGGSQGSTSSTGSSTSGSTTGSQSTTGNPKK